MQVRLVGAPFGHCVREFSWGSRPLLLSLSSLARGRKRCRGGPSNEIFPYATGNRYLLWSAPGPCRGQLAGPSSSCSPSSHLVLCDSVVSPKAKAGPIPSRIISSCCRMPFPWSGLLGTKNYISSASDESGANKDLCWMLVTRELITPTYLQK